MKKNYNIPAIEVVALESGMVMQTTPASPGQDPANPNNNNPGSGSSLIP